MKYCEVCGTLNLKENSYCTHCGCRIVEENICPFCGKKNSDSSKFCINCNRQITPIAIDSLDDLFSDYNFSLLINSNFSLKDYVDILNRIFKKLDYIKITGKTAKEKVLQIANVFTSVIPVSSGVAKGEYAIQYIFYDDRLDECFQISTIIHELAHFLLFDLAVNILSEIFGVKASPALKSFVEYVFIDSQIQIMNEFYAHTVENRYIPIEFQRFNSYYKCVSDLGFSEEDCQVFIELGSSYAQDIIHYLDKYIDENLRESIKLQFKIDMVEPKGNLSGNFGKELLDHDEKNKMFIGLMAFYFENLYNNKEARKELEYIKYKFED